MKTKIFITVLTILGGLLLSQAQIKPKAPLGSNVSSANLKGTTVVFVVDIPTLKTTHLVLTEDFPIRKRSAARKYPNAIFFKGILRGEYIISKTGILPIMNSTVIMYKDKPFFPGDMFFPGTNLISQLPKRRFLKTPSQI